MEQNTIVRPANDSDADEISKLVQKTIRISNAKDYSDAVIERLVANFATAAIQSLLKRRIVLVATQNEVIVGTASFDGNEVRTVFVVPEKQGPGIGRLLMEAIEAGAFVEGTTVLQVNSSLTAKPFYARIGFSKVVSR
jgi:N-acetylglutamate synthase-like GNAT family acetyltransferase